MTTTRQMPVRTLVTGNISYVYDDETVADAALRLAEKNIGALPVCDSRNRLNGMITDRDIVVEVVAKGKDPATTRVGDVSHGHLVTVSVDAPIDEALRLMADHKVRRLPVTDGTACIGVISQADIARHMPPAETGTLVARVSSES